MGGIAAILLSPSSPMSSLAVIAFGVGLALALDEWLYLIVTDGTNESYLLPVSFWGGIVATSAAAAYAVLVGWTSKKR